MHSILWIMLYVSSVCHNKVPDMGKNCIILPLELAVQIVHDVMPVSKNSTETLTLYVLGGSSVFEH